MDTIESNSRSIEKRAGNRAEAASETLGYRTAVATIPGTKNPATHSGIKVTLLTGGSDRHYAFGLAMGLVDADVSVDLIGGDQDDTPEMHSTPNLNFLNWHRSIQGGLGQKIWRVLKFYFRLIRYAAAAEAKIFHILWNNKFELFDRTVLTLYYKLLGKKIVLTAHNVNAGSRDQSDSALNRLTLKIQYKLVDHIFVHTAKMKGELIEQFAVDGEHISVIPYGVNNAVPITDVTCSEAKRRLGISEDDRVVLFYGAIKRYKGLEYLVEAFAMIARGDSRYRLIIAGDKKKGYEEYWEGIQETIGQKVSPNQVMQQIKFIPDDETESLFKAADVIVLPYTEIFQSGILFLAYSFGLPVVATDVGSFREEIVEGRTGFICKPNDARDLASALRKYFESDLFQHLEDGRQEIRAHVNRQNSWKRVVEITSAVYARLEAKMIGSMCFQQAEDNGKYHDSNE